ncbi:hypothetical protein IQ265_14575 [Nodosilinea sp. LEGE 06152]|uniref:hypothetical protein n=1 Tax=Nodosilinea sp. LEGE 06152 TaxID=2777966 RepID=UPI00188086E9|nr:hypothetical protein [Nodosilinea sp. LEGE 06152]MBE9158041.1 hypothetical protein [Nodosilinea sp. LEGE 06152]
MALLRLLSGPNPGAQRLGKARSPPGCSSGPQPTPPDAAPSPRRSPLKTLSG